MSFEQQRERSREVEKLLGRWLMSRGWRVLPVYDYSGKDDDKAPKLAAWAPEESLVTPDLLAARAGDFWWFEIKLKSRADWTFKTQRWETGFNLRHWNDYKRVEAESGCSVWVFFVHEKEDAVLAATLSELEPFKRVYEGGKMGRGGMVFFPFKQLRCIAKLSDVRRTVEKAA